jgi:hypothetical protein
MSEDAELAEAAAENLGLFRRIARLFEPGEYEPLTDAERARLTAGGPPYGVLTKEQRSRLIAGGEDEGWWIRDEGDIGNTYYRQGYGYAHSSSYVRNLPPADLTGTAPGYTTVYMFHGVDRDALMPDPPGKDTWIGKWTIDDRALGNARAAAHAWGEKGGPFVTVTKDMVDAADPPGNGRTSQMLVSEFRVPSERLFNPGAEPNVPMPKVEQGERYFLGNDLVAYKVGERINPFWG